VQLVRLVPSLHALYALRDRCQPIPAHIESQLPLWLESRSRGRRAELVICEALPCATLLGFDRPCIALPSTLVAALDVDELDQIVLHEHAHVQRRDDWTRLAQRLIEAVLWIHPAVVLIARALNREREMACDEWVVARTNAPRVYARCLAHAAEVRGRIAAPALGPALFGGRHDLIRRVDRLLAVKGVMRRRVSAFAMAVAACVIGIMSVQLNAFPLIGGYVETWLPEVGAPVARLTAAVLPTAISQVAETPAPFRMRLNAKPQNTAQSPPPSAHRPAASEVSTSTESEQPREGFDSREPSVLSARPIEAAYHPRTNPVSADSPSPWRAAALPGVNIARAARKTGVGIAGAFTRAGVGLAKSF
jgi:hypothetical protein